MDARSLRAPRRLRSPARLGARDCLRGRVGPLQTLSWSGGETQVRRIEISSGSGTTLYFVQPTGRRLLLRFVSPDGEVYELRPPAKP